MVLGRLLILYQLAVLKAGSETKEPVSMQVVAEIIFQPELISIYFCPKELEQNKIIRTITGILCFLRVMVAYFDKLLFPIYSNQLLC
jgi:hypothetical protein